MKFGALEMKPIYFPFTYVTRQTAEAFGAFFNAMIVYQASGSPLPSQMQALEENEFFEVRVPDASDQARFDDVVKNFKSWGELHFDSQGVRTVFSRSATEPVPFFNETATSQIVADVKGDSHSGQTRRRLDLGFDARIFIELAQHYDRYCYEIEQDLGRYDEKMKDLFADIKGAGEYSIADDASGTGNFRIKPADFMTLRRLHAWSYLFGQDTVDTGIMLTDSPFLIEYLLDHLPSVEKIQSYQCLSCPGLRDETDQSWRENLMAKLTSVVEGGRNASGEMPRGEFSTDGKGPPVSLDLYLVPESRPIECLTACIAKSIIRPDHQIPKSNVNHTVFGLITYPG
jgi:hypothetical protein